MLLHIYVVIYVLIYGYMDLFTYGAIGMSVYSYWVI